MILEQNTGERERKVEIYFLTGGINFDTIK
jgi:hypothetical protein